MELTSLENQLAHVRRWVLWYLLDREASSSNKSRGTAGCQQTDIVVHEALGKIQKASLVVDGENSSLLGGGRRHCGEIWA